MLRTAFAESELQRHVSNQQIFAHHGDASACSELIQVCDAASAAALDVFYPSLRLTYLLSCCKTTTQLNLDAVAAQAVAASVLIFRSIS
jgi:hypothetical protein